MAKGEVLEIEQTALVAPTMMGLLSLAIQKESTIDVIERLAALQLEMRRLDAELDFNQALTQCQQEIRLVVNDTPGQHKKYSSYRALDREVRPIYLRSGLSISFGSADCSIPEHILVTCHVSRGLHTRIYQLPMDASGKGPKGEGALSKPHAILAAAEYGRRCLLKLIFNIVTGDEEDFATNGELAEAIEKIANAPTPDDMKKAYTDAYNKFEAVPAAIKVLIAARNKARKEFQDADSRGN